MMAAHSLWKNERLHVCFSEDQQARVPPRPFLPRTVLQWNLGVVKEREAVLIIDGGAVMLGEGKQRGVSLTESFF